MHNIWLIAFSIILGQMTWPVVGLPVLLGPAFLLGVAPLVTWSLLQYLVVALISAGLGSLQGNYWLGLITLLQFLLWYVAHKREQTPWWVVATLLPLGLLIGLQAEKPPMVYLFSLGSVIAQTLLYRGLTAVSQQRIKQLKAQHRQQNGAERLSTTLGYWQELEQLPPLAQAFKEVMEQTYGAYQDLELLARSTPRIPQPLVQDLLSAAQQIHQLRLQLQEWHSRQEKLLAEAVGSDTRSLRTLLAWVSLLATDMATKRGQQVDTFIDLEQDTWLTRTEQLPLGSLLLFICSHGLNKLTASHVHLRFSGFVANEGLRLVITMAPDSQTVSGEWPQLEPCDLGPVAKHAQKLQVLCQNGITSLGEHIYTLEIS